jgi:PEP-CTERM motif
MNSARSLRRRIFASTSCALLAGTILVISVGPLPAENIIFTIDSSSTETLAGTDPSGFPFTAQGAGGLTTGVFGNFVLSFDPATDLSLATSMNIQFPSAASGFFKFTSPTTTGTPGLNGSSTPSPANFAGQGTGGFTFAWRNIGFNFHSDVIGSTSISGGTATFDTNTTYFNVNSAQLDSQNPDASTDFAGSMDNAIDAGDTWVLNQTSPGTWSLNLTGTFTSDYGPTTMVFTSNISATAQFDVASNVVNDVPPQVGQSEPVTVSVLAGAASPTDPGAVSVTLPTTNTSNVTSISVQQIPITGISQDAANAAESSRIFAAAIANPELTSGVQVWEVSPIGFTNGSDSATLVFHFDPDLFTPAELADLGMWHFNTLTQQWDFGGEVNLFDNTITYTTNSFSIYAAGTSTAFLPTPEPSTFVLAGMGILSLAYFIRRRRNGSRR